MGGRSIFVGGLWENPSSELSTLEIRNPATEEILGHVSQCGPSEVDRAVRAAREAQWEWNLTPAIERGGFLKKAAQSMRAQTHELALLLSRETGKPLCESHDCLEWVSACFDYYAEAGRSERGSSFPPVARNQVSFTVKEPYGVVAAIVPFNFPLLLWSWKVAPALMAGNTVVCKPPHQNPLSSLLISRCMESFPKGVYNIVTGDGKTGEALTRHPEVDCIAFTGSTEVGRKIASQAGLQLKKLNLELGGIDPLIVFDDADLEIAIRGAAWARLLNAGQVCTSSKRIYLTPKIAGAFTVGVVEYVNSLHVGDPLDSQTDVGPLISKDAVDKVDSQVKRAVEAGATILTGGHRLDRKGHFYAPTVLAHVEHGSFLTQEEVFGPVLALIETSSPEDAIRKANDSKFGLGCSIFTNNLEWTMQAMQDIKAGTFWVNDPLSDNDAAPFGGMRNSGIGRELGVEGLDAFREPKHVHLDFKMAAKPYWFPYRNRSM